MKEELEIAKFDIGRRYYAGNGNNYGSVKTLKLYASTDNENYTEVGGFTFTFPWTAPDGTVVEGPNSPLIPAYEEIVPAEPVKARYMKMKSWKLIQATMRVRSLISKLTKKSKAINSSTY